MNPYVHGLNEPAMPQTSDDKRACIACASPEQTLWGIEMLPRDES